MRACKLIPGHLLRAHSFAYKFCLISLSLSLGRASSWVPRGESHVTMQNRCHEWPLSLAASLSLPVPLSFSAWLTWIHRRQWKCLVWFRATSPRGCKGIIKEMKRRRKRAKLMKRSLRVKWEWKTKWTAYKQMQTGQMENRTVHQMRTRNSFNHLYLWVNFLSLSLTHSLALTQSPFTFFFSSFAIHFFRLVTLIFFQRHWFSVSYSLIVRVKIIINEEEVKCERKI